MNCNESEALLPAYLDEELAGPERAALEAHLSSCERCRASVAALEREEVRLRGAFAAPRAAAAALAARVAARLPPVPAGGPASPAARPPRVVFLWIAAAAAAGFLVAVAVFRPWEVNVREVVREVPVPREKVVVVEVEKPAAVPEATLALATPGAVELLPAGGTDWRPLAIGGAIPRGARTRTGESTRAKIRAADGSEVCLDRGTEVVFHSPRSFELAAGRLWSTVEPGESPFAVIVPRAEATVTALGTQFDVRLEQSQATVLVARGSTRVEGKDRGKDAVILAAGEAVTVSAGALASKTQAEDLALATSWLNEVLALEGGRNPELEKRLIDILAQIGQTKLSFLYEDEIRRLGDRCVLPLTSYVESERSRDDADKRVRAMRIVADLAQPWSIPDLVLLLGDSEPQVRYHAARGLERLTGQTRGRNPADWLKMSDTALADARAAWAEWLEDNRGKIPPRPY